MEVRKEGYIPYLVHLNPSINNNKNRTGTQLLGTRRAYNGIPHLAM